MMFTSTCVIICMCYLVPITCSELEFNDIANILALDLFNVMPNSNLVVSTLMVKLPLIKLAVYASGETKQELMTALGYKTEKWMIGAYRRLYETLELLQSTGLLFVNKLYVNYTNEIVPDFFQNSELQYGVKVETVSFNYPKAVTSFINKWIGALTYRRITEIVDDNDVTRDTTMLIINAIYFAATWATSFNYARTKFHPFHHMNGSTTQVQMMMKVDGYAYVDTGEYEAIKLQLLWDKTYVTFLLPHDKRALPSILDKVYENTNYLAPFLNRMKTALIALKMPKFKIKTYVDWTGFLQEIGVTSVFNCSLPGLSGMLKPDPNRKRQMCLSKVKQKVFMEVDEMGVNKRIFNRILDGAKQEHYADNIDTMPARELVFNRPFLFMVNIHFSNVHNHELLTGVYYGPE